MDDGEVNDMTSPRLEQAYNPELEWPGDTSNVKYGGYNNYFDSPADEPTAKSGIKDNHRVFRLLVLQTSILSPKQKLVIIDGYPELQFGRDVAPRGSVVPRIRLKEMEVSKLHATAYWNGATKEWSIVDMGSKHGTFVQSGSSAELGVRLSPPRVASIPRRLHHMDRITVGSTTFLVHIHNDNLLCVECSPKGGDDMPLFPVQKPASAKRSRDVFDDGSSITSAYTPKPENDPRKALSLLKRNLLTRHSAPSSESRSKELDATYVDRAARRRAFAPSLHPDAPGVNSSSMPMRATSEISQSAAQATAESPMVSAPPTPLSSTNIGHQLLLKQGWAPGEALGIESSDDRMALIEPLDVNPNRHRAGLGTKGPPANATPTHGANWKEIEKRRRFEEARASAAG